MTDNGKLPRLVNAGQVARLLSKRPPAMKQTNIRPWLRRRGIEPVAEADHPIGSLYSKPEILKARDAWYAERDRGTDVKRSEAALAKAAERRA